MYLSVVVVLCMAVVMIKLMFAVLTFGMVAPRHIHSVRLPPATLPPGTLRLRDPIVTTIQTLAVAKLALPETHSFCEWSVNIRL